MKICIIHFLVTCCVSGFVNFWSTKYHTQPCFRFVIPTNVIISSEELPHCLHHGSRPCLTTARTINPPDSPSYSHKFARPIRFAVGKLLSALAVDPPCESLFQILSPPRIYSIPWWIPAFWAVGMSVLLELTAVPYNGGIYKMSIDTFT